MRTASLCFAILLSVGCGPNPDDGNASYQVRESVEQLHVTHANPAATLTLFDASGAMVQSGTTDKLGSLIFRKVTPGAGYVVKDMAAGQYSRKLTVQSIDGSLPGADFYRNQKLVPGFNYITTRDGTTLSAYITLPGPVENGPYPTVVNYSGYDPSKPGEPIENGKYSFLCDSLPTLCDAPNDPSGLIASLFGFATVSVNMRGTGCSGGAYDYFEPLQLLDGYDVIETVAAQDWVSFHKVGMTGLSYPGITQLFVAKTRPPSLAAITPLSVIGNTATTLVPGGILNDGFALEWVTSVLDKADPYGQGWEQARVDGGDATCKENQLLHLQKVDNVALAKQTQYYDPAIVDPLNPTLFVDQIQVPVFIAGAFEDEQTGPFFTTLLDKFKGAPLLRANVYNGVHPDGFAPQVMGEWKNFLDLYVAHRIPTTPGLVATMAPILFEQIFNSSMKLPPDRFGMYATADDARAAYEKELPLRAIFESGNTMDVGAPQGAWEQRFTQWPPKETTPLRFYFHADGSMDETMPVEPPDSASSFQLDPDAGERGILAPNGNVWDKIPAYDWKQLVPGDAASFETAPLAEDVVMLGTGSADLWIKSTADDADLEINVSELRPDGKEMYVQSGWLRASVRKDGPDSTELWPSPTYTQADAQPLKPGEWVLARVPIAAFGHTFRKGSKIRVSVDTPGDSRALWRFALKKFNPAPTHTVGHSMMYPSSVALPRLMGVTAPTPLPPCPSLRGMQCRDIVPYQNTPAQ